MTTPELLSLLQQYYFKYQTKIYPAAAVTFLVLGTIFILLGIFFSKSNTVQAKTAENFSNAITSKIKTVTEDIQPDKKIVVDIAGAVVKPGVYTLKADQRLLSVIEVAGGFDPKVNKNYVAHSLNLSQQLTDQQKIYIPFQNEKFDASYAAFSPNQSSQTPTSQLINLNTASLPELETLTGVGEVRAQNVISGRPFKSMQELVQRKILTQKILDDNKEKIKI